MKEIWRKIFVDIQQKYAKLCIEFELSRKNYRLSNSTMLDFVVVQDSILVLAQESQLRKLGYVYI